MAPFTPQVTDIALVKLIHELTVDRWMKRFDTCILVLTRTNESRFQTNVNQFHRDTVRNARPPVSQKRYQIANHEGEMWLSLDRWSRRPTWDQLIGMM